MMKFCEVCDNMLYTKVLREESESVLYFCRNCSSEFPMCDPADETKTNVLSRRIIKKAEVAESGLNKYTKYDARLPSITAKCKTSTCENTEILWVRYDGTQLKYAYVCPKCDATWTD